MCISWETSQEGSLPRRNRLVEYCGSLALQKLGASQAKMSTYVAF